MLVGDVVSRDALKITENGTMGEAAMLLVNTYSNGIIVTDADGHYLGTLSRGDLIRVMMPDVEELYRKRVSYFGLNEYFICNATKKTNKSIKPYIVRDSITLQASDPLVKAAVIMIKNNIDTLPVLDEGNILGLISRSDILKILIDEHEIRDN